jgi:hypothetical protein
MRTLREQHRGELRTARDRLRTARQTFDEARRAAGTDEAALRGAAGALATAQADIMVLRARQRAQLTGVLTPEQRAAAQRRRAVSVYAARTFGGWQARRDAWARQWSGRRGMEPRGPSRGGRGWRGEMAPWWWGPTEPGGPPPRHRRQI